MAHNNGDVIYKSAVQQLHLRFPIVNKEGKPQTIDFSPIANVKVGVETIALNAHRVQELK
ncbi:hypothetical protein [Flavobacterium commune]|uniref:hypothetical protein n=1 Tax=Flavobacterium commune TaxID=1306519 RepID=UPI0018DE6A7A|nr:hypothetical protein [Flavobacterium commune]